MQPSAVRSALLVVFIAGSAGDSSVFAKPKATAFAEDGSGCPGFSQSVAVKDRAIVFNWKNRCQKPIHCTVNWEVSCEESEDSSEETSKRERKTQKEAHEEEMDLGPGATKKLTAQAGCSLSASWRISPATWRCRFKSSEPESASR